MSHALNLLSSEAIHSSIELDLGNIYLSRQVCSHFLSFENGECIFLSYAK